MHFCWDVISNKTNKQCTEITVIYIGFIQNDDTEYLYIVKMYSWNIKSGLHLSHHSVDLFIYLASVYDYFDI